MNTEVDRFLLEATFGTGWQPACREKTCERESIMRMSARVFIGTLLIGAGALTAWAGETGGKVAAAEAALQSGDLMAAAKAYALAARENPQDQQLRMQALLVKRALTLSRQLDKISNPERWHKTAIALHAFYLDHGVYQRALELDRQILARVPGPASAALLARTQLELRQDADAVATLAACDKLTPEGEALLALALARQGRAAEADAAVQRVALDAQSGPEVILTLARAEAQRKHAAEAIALLKRGLAATPPKQIEAVRASLAACGDFEAFAGTEELKAALDTASEVKQSDCSSGESCGKCPSRSSCGSASKGD